jgi:DNA-binding XRE family transcriptional regulator
VALKVIVLGSKGVVSFMQVRKGAFNGVIEDSGLRNSALAKKVECTPQYISALRKGHRKCVSPDMGIRIARALGVRVDTIFVPKEESGADLMAEAV